MKKANFFFFLTLLHAPTHPYPSSLSASCLHPSFPYSDSPSFFLTLSPESLPYSPSSPPYHLPTSSLPPPCILPTTSLLPLCILPATFLGECFPLQIYRARFIVPVPPDRLHIHPAVSPCFLRLQSDYPRRDVGGTSEKPRS